MRTTSAEITSPTRMSLLLSDSSNSAAKAPLLPLVAVTVVDAVMGFLSPEELRQSRAMLATEVAEVGLNTWRHARGLTAAEGSVAPLFAASGQGLRQGPERTALCPPCQHLIDRFVDAQVRVVEQECIFGRLQRRNAAILVARIARFQVSPKTVDISGNALRNQLLM